MTPGKIISKYPSDTKGEIIGKINIIRYDDQHAIQFERLNREWLEGYGLIEEADTKHLISPYETIVAPGGQIFFAIDNGQVVGTGAAIKHEGNIEIAKLTVDSSYRGKGIGKLLTEAVIEFAQSIDTEKVFLVSNTRLKKALSLYESMGFEYMPLPDKTEYVTADVYMELILKNEGEQ